MDAKKKAEEDKRAEPSDIFVDVVTDSSGIHVTCELCGRTIFEDDDSAGSWEPDELEDLRKRAQETPDDVIGFTTCSVGTGRICGKQVVTNCPCKGLRPYEDFIWSHRHLIAEYLEKRTKKMAEAAYDDEAEAIFLKENVARQDRDIKFSKCQDCGGYFSREILSENLLCFKCERENKFIDEKHSHGLYQCSHCHEWKGNVENGLCRACTPVPVVPDDGDNLPF